MLGESAIVNDAKQHLVVLRGCIATAEYTLPGPHAGAAEPLLDAIDQHLDRLLDRELPLDDTDALAPVDDPAASAPEPNMFQAPHPRRWTVGLPVSLRPRLAG